MFHAVIDNISCETKIREKQVQFYLADPSEALSVQTVFKCTPPSVLYHYTKRRGLLGILDKRSVYASHMRYLNDAREMIHAMDLIQSILNARLAVAIGEQKQLYEQAKQWIESLKFQNQVFVFSMSQEGDSLSQWRAYCDSNDGYAIGFDSNKLKRHADSLSFYMAPCVYDLEAQDALVSLLLEDVNDELQKKIQLGTSVQEAISQASTYFVLLFLILAPVLKAPAFKEEKEWRLISIFKHGFGQPTVQYRDGRSLLIPYVAMEIAPKDEPLPIVEVVVGPTEETISPTSHRILEQTAVTGLLIKANASGHQVRSSVVPYRGN